MNSSFVTYIDESGDEGFVFNNDGSGSSRWFVISAAVIRKKNDLQMVECMKETRKILRKTPNKPLHFVDLRHEQRIPYMRKISSLPIRTVTVLVYKPLIKEPEKFQSQKYLLYHYATRMVLERVSWLCRDMKAPDGGDGYTDIIFSNRSNMSYDDIRNYLRLLLKQGSDTPMKVQVDASVIDPSRIESIEHSKRAGLQVVDGIASGIHYAVKRNIYGETETAYINHIKKTLYRHNKTILGYGLKIWPDDIDAVKAKAPEAGNLEGL
jgi:hypothetical protein